jgi:hypothetical protein
MNNISNIVLSDLDDMGVTAAEICFTYFAEANKCKYEIKNALGESLKSGLCTVNDQMEVMILSQRIKDSYPSTIGISFKREEHYPAESIDRGVEMVRKPGNELFELGGEKILQFFIKDPEGFPLKFGEEGVLRLYNEIGVGVDPFRKYWKISAEEMLQQYMKGKRDFSWAYLGAADLRGSRFKGISLKGAMLSGANLVRTSLLEADLTGANLRGADLRASLFIKADLRWANLRDADLSKSNFFDHTDFRGANLTRSDLRDADFSGALFDGATLTNVVVESSRDLLTSDWTTLIIGNKTYQRHRVESGEEVLPIIQS